MLAWQGITEYNSLHNRNILTFHGEGKEKKMIPVSIEKFADMTLESNQDMDRQELLQSLKNALRAKQDGAKCMQCGSPIWAAGSAVTGMHMCFTCTTLEADDSGDYEIE